jgi:hypothetical protein
MSAVEELSDARTAVGYVSPMMYPWPVNADGTYTLAPLGDSVAAFQRPPADDAAAYRLAAYWQAVAARALEDRTLGLSAFAYLGRATAAMASYENANRVQILAEAASKIESEMAGVPVPADTAGKQKRGIATLAVSMLRNLSTPSQLQRGTEEDTSLLATFKRQYDSFVALMKKVATGLAITAGVLSAAVVAGLVWWFVSRRKKKK